MNDPLLIKEAYAQLMNMLAKMNDEERLGLFEQICASYCIDCGAELEFSECPNCK